MQTTAAMRSKRLTNRDAATQGEDINPMAPHFNTEPKSSQSVPFGKPQPRPHIATMLKQYLHAQGKCYIQLTCCSVVVIVLAKGDGGGC